MQTWKLAGMHIWDQNAGWIRRQVWYDYSVMSPLMWSHREWLIVVCRHVCDATHTLLAISKGTHFAVALYSTKRASWNGVVLVLVLRESICFSRKIRQDDFSHFRPKWPWPLTSWPHNCSASFTPKISNVSSKCEHCMLFRFELWWARDRQRDKRTGRQTEGCHA